MVDQFVELVQQSTILADEIGLDLQAKKHPGLLAFSGNLRQLIGCLVEVIFGIATLWMVKRKTIFNIENP